MKSYTQKEVVGVIIQSMSDKKAENIVCLNMKNILKNVCDYFVICDGNSSTQVDTIAKAVEDDMYKTIGESVHHREGYNNAEWILLDYIDVVVHIFQPQQRRHYNLEGLWADAKHEDIKELYNERNGQ